METIKIVLSFFLFLIVGQSNAQMAGNQVYKNNQSSTYTRIQRKSIRTTDSTLIINARVLFNKVADYYLVSVGLSQEEPNIKACNQKINIRIKNLKDKLQRLNIQEQDVYVDFIAQTKVYDYNVKDRIAEQFLRGFEIKKNVIIKVDKINKIEPILEFCSEESIFDIIKVEYINENLEATYDQLFDEAMELIDIKKKRFLKYSAVQLSGKNRIVKDDFHTFYPKNQYQKYSEAFESSSYALENQSYKSGKYIRKDLRKQNTFYYDAQETNSAYDKVLNDIAPNIGIQYQLEVEMLYELKP